MLTIFWLFRPMYQNEKLWEMMFASHNMNELRNWQQGNTESIKFNIYFYIYDLVCWRFVIYSQERRTHILLKLMQRRTSSMHPTNLMWMHLNGNNSCDRWKAFVRALRKRSSTPQIYPVTAMTSCIFQPCCTHINGSEYGRSHISKGHLDLLIINSMKANCKKMIKPADEKTKNGKNMIDFYLNNYRRLLENDSYI